MTYSEPVVPCPACEGWKPVEAKFCAECFEGQIERLKKALEASQELLVTSLNYRDNEYLEDTEKQAAINRRLLGPAT